MTAIINVANLCNTCLMYFHLTLLFQHRVQGAGKRFLVSVTTGTGCLAVYYHHAVDSSLQSKFGHWQ
ncbi:hypothetical protein XELAEV_18031295mg [Xenopus laevis]|uniref:Uncharacterized protein n=1 Tax=Xenopus laevis TaxID=8355 RepID=A0A974CNJ1_XENLA|nr:hypothetical protein XELAEV_18031295mg [Xenopus laevis]